VLDRANYRAAAVFKHFSADYVAGNPHRSILIRPTPELLRRPLTLDVLYELARARNAMALGIDNLVRLTDVQIADPVKGEIVQLIKDAVQIDAGKGLGPHLGRDGC